MQTRLWRAAGFVLGAAGLGGLTVAANRSQRLREDRIPNPNQEPYLDFAEKERRAGKSQFSPWVTTNQQDLALVQRYFPQVSVSKSSPLGKVVNKPVEVLSLGQANRHYDGTHYTILSRMMGYGFYEYQRAKSGQSLDYQMTQTQEPLFIAVGGAAAAMAAYQRAKEGKPVLYVQNEVAESGYYDELTSFTDEPLKLLGSEPLNLLQQSLKAYVKPPRYAKEVLNSEFSRFNLNGAAWLKAPGQWRTGMKVLWGNYRLTQQPVEAKKASTQQEHQALEQADQELGLLRQPREALLVARTKQEEQAFSKAQEVLSTVYFRGDALREKYGFYPRRALGFMEKKPAYIAEPQQIEKLVQGIRAQGGTVVTNWHLSRVLVDIYSNQGGILEFRETTEAGELRHHQRQFSQAYLALGETVFSPNPYPVVKVTKVSIKALLLGVNLAAGPVYFGGTIVPLTAAKRVDVGDKTKGDMDITDLSVVQITAGISVGPAGSRASEPGYNGRQAIHLIENVQTTLPRDAKLKILSVTGSSSVLGAEGRPVVVHPVVKDGFKTFPVETVAIQIGGGTELALNPSTLFSQKALAKKTEIQLREQEHKVSGGKGYSPKR